MSSHLSLRRTDHTLSRRARHRIGVQHGRTVDSDLASTVDAPSTGFNVGQRVDALDISG